MKSQIIFLFLLLSLFACKQELSLEDPAKSSEPQAQGLLYNPDFIQFVDKIQAISLHDIDPEALKESVESEDYEAIALYAGFNSLNHAQASFEELAALYQGFVKELGLNSLSDTEREILLSEAVYDYISDVVPMKSSCGADNQNCLQAAMGDFTVLSAGCVGAGVAAGIGGTPVAGGFVYIVCQGAALYELDADRANCQYEYQRCLNKAL